MVNKSFIKMSARAVKGSFSRFLAIVSIVALGAGFLAGLLATTPDMKENANSYFKESNLYDFYIQSTLGFSGEDVKAVSDLSYVKQVMAIEQEDIMMEDESKENLETRVFHVDFDDDDAINKLILVDGRFPKNSDECVLVVPNKYSYEAAIGDVFTASDGRKYKTSGIAASPLFLSNIGENTQLGKGSISLGMFVKKANDVETYTALYGIGKLKSKDTFSDEYRKEIEKIDENLEKFGETQIKVRREQLVSNAQKELDEKRAVFENEKKDALAKLEDNKITIDKNTRTLNDSEKQLKESLLQVNSGLDEISRGEKEIKNGLEALKDGIYELNNKETEIAGMISEINTAMDKIKKEIEHIEKQLADQGLPPEIQESLKAEKNELEKQWTKLDKKASEIQQAIGKIRENKIKLEKDYDNLFAAGLSVDEQKKELAAAKKMLLSKEQEIKDGKAKLKAATEKYLSGKDTAESGFAKAEKHLEDAQKQIDNIDSGKWYITNRLETQGISSYKSDTEKVAAIARIFPVFFFLVAALVVLTTMTRMIEEERAQVGTLKSLGYKNGIIRNYYLLYGAVASLIGCVAGLGLGFIIFPKVISNAYAMIYNIPPVSVRIIWHLAGAITLITLIIIMSTIYFACRRELREKPASLLLPKAPEAGKRILLEKITPLWKRIKFTHKVTLRNLFRYKKRFLMTIVGMAGCFALLVTGFGVRDSINDIVDIQYGELMKYDMTVSVDKESWKPVEDIYGKQGFFMQTNAKVINDKKSDMLTISVPENKKAMDDFMTLRTRDKHKMVFLDDNGVVLSEKLCEELDIKKGDKIKIQPDGEKETEIKVIGICENYVSNIGFMTSEGYTKFFGSQPTFKTLYVDIKDEVKEKESSDSIVRKVMEEDGVLYALATDTIRDNFNDSVKNIDYIVMVLIISAGGLSIIVLYNLTNVNICERKKELATIKVLGFYEKEVSSYIFREINILAGIGMLFGIPLGSALHRFVIKTAEVGSMMFGRNIYFLSFLFSVLITGAFTFIVNLIMRRSIRKIDMVESMKAND